MRHENRSRHQLHSGHVHCLCINMQAFSVVVPRHSMVVLVETSRARCRSDTPRAPVHPSGCTTCRPYRRLSRCCTYTACTCGCIPSRRGGAAWPRCRQGERPHSGRSGSVCTGPPARPASMFALRRSPGGSSRSRLRTSSGWASSPAARSHSEGTAGSVCRLSRAWRESINTCHFRRASAWHHTAPTGTLPLWVFRAMQGSSSLERLIGRGGAYSPGVAVGCGSSPGRVGACVTPLRGRGQRHLCVKARQIVHTARI